MSAYISRRLSIRWLPDEPYEDTDTIVLTGTRTGAFVDVRFLKESSSKKELDWAFAGYKISSKSNKNLSLQDELSSYKEIHAAGPDSAKWARCIDSRTSARPPPPKSIRFQADFFQTPGEVEDHGTNSTLPDGTVLEVGSMINPRTNKMTPYEEIWADVESDSALFVKSKTGNVWRACVGDVQLAVGRKSENNEFWAWEAERKSAGDPWKVVRSTLEGVDTVKFLPSAEEWKEGDIVEWDRNEYEVLEKGLNSKKVET